MRRLLELAIHTHTVTEDTTKRLLLFGGKRQQSVLAPAASANTRRQVPEREFHRRQVPSDDAEAMKSLAADQSKSVVNCMCVCVCVCVCERERERERERESD